MDFEITGAVWNVLPNEYLTTIMNRNLERVGGFTYTPEEIKFAEDIRKTLSEPPSVAIGSQETVQPSRVGAVGTASTDLADVSWNVPTVSMTAATFVPGVPAHSWQATACAGGSIGIKGMMVAAKTMALTTVDLFTDPSHIQKAKAEFDQKRGPGFVYKTRLADRKPALDYRK
jgi:aminobenzoyl-glutamate utilization protein B